MYSDSHVADNLSFLLRESLFPSELEDGLSLESKGTQITLSLHNLNNTISGIVSTTFIISKSSSSFRASYDWHHHHFHIPQFFRSLTLYSSPFSFIFSTLLMLSCEYIESPKLFVCMFKV